jgi:hypothetical protein
MPILMRAWVMGTSVRVAKYQKAPIREARKLALRLLSPTREATYWGGIRALIKPTAKTPP